MAQVPDPNLIPAVPSEAARSSARAFAGVGIALNVIAFLAFGGRLVTRSFPVFRLGADDYIIAIAYILVLVDSILLLITIPFVFGRDPNTLTLADIELANHYAILAEPIWAWSMCAIKTSVALMLLRLETEIAMRRFLWGNIVVQILLGMYNMLAQLLQCIPLRAAWDLLGVVEARCWSKEAIRINLICVSTVNILTDFIFALIPISFIRKVQRPLRERAIIGVLMALGVFAGVSSIIKVQAGARFGRTDDPTREGIEIGMWSCIEELVGLIAACLPCLRSPFQRVLEYFGLVTTQPKSTYGRYGQMYGESGKLKSSRSRKSEVGPIGSGMGIKMKSMRNTDAQSEENILTGEEVKNGEIWCTTEVHLEEARRTPRVDVEHGNRSAQASWNDDVGGPGTITRSPV